MSVHKQFEAAANMADWPPNEPNKPTQAAVFGVYHPKKGKAFEILWTGQFPDLEPALYWAAKKEIEAGSARASGRSPAGWFGSTS